MAEKAPKYNFSDGDEADGSEARFVRPAKPTVQAEVVATDQWVPPVAVPGAFERTRVDAEADELDATLPRPQVQALRAGLSTELSSDPTVADALSAVEDAYNDAAHRVVGVEGPAPVIEKSPREQAENAAHAAREQLSDDEATVVWSYAVEFKYLQTADPKAQNNIIAQMSKLKARIGTDEGKRVASMYEAAYSIN